MSDFIGKLEHSLAIQGLEYPNAELYKSGYLDAVAHANNYFSKMLVNNEELEQKLAKTEAALKVAEEGLDYYKEIIEERLSAGAYLRQAQRQIKKIMEREG